MTSLIDYTKHPLATFNYFVRHIPVNTKLLIHAGAFVFSGPSSERRHKKRIGQCLYKSVDLIERYFSQIDPERVSKSVPKIRIDIKKLEDIL